MCCYENHLYSTKHLYVADTLNELGRSGYQRLYELMAPLCNMGKNIDSVKSEKP